MRLAPEDLNGVLNEYLKQEIDKKVEEFVDIYADRLRHTLLNELRSGLQMEIYRTGMESRCGVKIEVDLPGHKDQSNYKEKES